MKLDRKIAQKSQRYFMTGVSLITSNGSQGQNVMAAEWTMQVSYEPMLIAVFIHEDSSTLKNVLETKAFGVNVASEEQTISVSIAGGYSRKEIDKLRIRNAFEFVKAKKINVPLIAGCILNAECEVVTTKKIGDHVMVVGNVVFICHDVTKKPLVYHQGKYFKMGHAIKPFRQEVKINCNLFDLFSKRANGKFVLKCVGILIKSKGNLLVERSTKLSLEIIPHFEPARGQDYQEALEKYLKKSKLIVTVKPKPFLKRLIFKNGNRMQRANFIIFEGRVIEMSSKFRWESLKHNSLLKNLDYDVV
ncbi:MAG: flavin reductase family protein [Thaumarchaeota archaeon]|nr:MAG: flavin reductase family protein [Nitrososphaerota archaeon]